MQGFVSERQAMLGSTPDFVTCSNQRPCVLRANCVLSPMYLKRISHFILLAEVNTTVNLTYGETEA